MSNYRVSFVFCCLIIIMISVIDIYWLVKNSSLILEFEMNPIGRWLIYKDGGSVALFVSLKVIGTFTVISTLIFLYKIHALKTMIVASVLSLLQLILLCYLLW